MGEADEAGAGTGRARQLVRLRRIEGQVRGLQQMIEAGRGCVEISRQTDAAIGALRRVQADLLRDHMQALVGAVLSGGLPEEERRRLADELGRLVAKVV